jgi:hypothetical protein
MLDGEREGAAMSDKPIAERLQVKGDRSLAVLGAPADADRLVGAMHARTDAQTADVVVLFAKDRASLDRDLPAVLAQLRAGAILWIAYPKLTSPLAGDLHRDVIRALAPGHGLDPVAQIAIDDDWSALRLKRLA